MPHAKPTDGSCSWSEPRKESEGLIAWACSLVVGRSSQILWLSYLYVRATKVARSKHAGTQIVIAFTRDQRMSSAHPVPRQVDTKKRSNYSQPKPPLAPWPGARSHTARGRGFTEKSSTDTDDAVDIGHGACNSHDRVANRQPPARSSIDGGFDVVGLGDGGFFFVWFPLPATIYCTARVRLHRSAVFSEPDIDPARGSNDVRSRQGSRAKSVNKVDVDLGDDPHLAGDNNTHTPAQGAQDLSRTLTRAFVLPLRILPLFVPPFPRPPPSKKHGPTANEIGLRTSDSVVRVLSPFAGIAGPVSP